MKGLHTISFIDICQREEEGGGLTIQAACLSRTMKMLLGSTRCRAVITFTPDTTIFGVSALLSKSLNGAWHNLIQPLDCSAKSVWFNQGGHIISYLWLISHTVGVPLKGLAKKIAVVFHSVALFRTPCAILVCSFSLDTAGLRPVQEHNHHTHIILSTSHLLSTSWHCGYL